MRPRPRLLHRHPRWRLSWVAIGVLACGPVEPEVTEETERTHSWARRHFSNMLVPGGERARLGRDPTDREWLAAFDNFVAYAETYERTDSTLTGKRHRQSP